MPTNELNNAQLTARLLALENRVSQLEARGIKVTQAELIIRDQEYQRVVAEMRLIMNSYDAHQDWRPADRNRYQVLRNRKKELKNILGLTA